MFDAYEALEAEKLQNTEIEFPQYRYIDNLQYFKLIDKKTVVSIRNDNQVKGIGISEEISLMQFHTIYGYKKCNKEVYESISQAIFLKIFDHV